MVRCEEEELRLEEEEEVGLVVLGGRWKVDQRKVEGGPTEDGKVEGGR